MDLQPSEPTVPEVPIKQTPDGAAPPQAAAKENDEAAKSHRDEITNSICLGLGFLLGGLGGAILGTFISYGSGQRDAKPVKTYYVDTDRYRAIVCENALHQREVFVRYGASHEYQSIDAILQNEKARQRLRSEIEGALEKQIKP